MAHPEDVCECGEYRRDHKDGTGYAFEMMQGGRDCRRFKLWIESADDENERTRPAGLSRLQKTNR